jgi:hypothetical protein
VVSPPRDRRILGVGVALACAGFALPWLDETRHLNAWLYVVATSLLTFELLDIAARYWLGALVAAKARGVAPRPAALGQVVRPFAIVMSVRNIKAKALRVLAGLTPYKTHVWIIDDGSTDDTAAYLEFLGWRCLRAETNRKKPGAIKALLKRLPREIATVLVLDPDCELLSSGAHGMSDLEHAVLKFQQSGAAACCPRVRIREGNALTAFQLLEVELAFLLGRKSLSPHCITTGASLYERTALDGALEQHSLSVYAEDLENTLIILEQGRAILYDDELVLTTEGKHTLHGWFSQRVGWSFGLIRVFAQRRRSVARVARFGPWAFYNFVVYLGLLSIVLFPLKLAGTVLFTVSFANALDTLFFLDSIPEHALTDPRYFTVTYAAYALLCACFHVYARPPVRFTTAVTAVVFYPFYAIAHTAAMAVGYLNWLSFCAIGRRIYRDHYAASMGRENEPLFGSIAAPSSSEAAR